MTEGSIDRVVLACLLLIAGLLADPGLCPRIAWLVEALAAMALLLVIGMVGAVSSYLVLWHAGPLTDPLLDSADHLLGFDWLYIRNTTTAGPWLLLVLERAYYACFWLPSAIILLLCASGRTARMHRLLAAFGVAILLGLPVFFLMPAAAAFDFYGYAPVPANARHYGMVISALQAHEMHAIDLTDLGGIISFPSFHASMAVLFAWALWPFRLLRIVSLPLNLLMWFAAIPIGGHYVVDVLGGTLVAVAALRLTDRSPHIFRVRPGLFAAVRLHAPS
ncbi:phosphatase PAP2 family protein [Sphingomonas trueperi]|uniref:phosphatase PAP2 family protein n=1 Tax=Sphingomonas trueperi TaxID=53317 RepID=UPI0015FF5FF8